MKDITEFINGLPNILSNVVFGFVFISVFHLVTRRHNDSNKKYLIMCSIAISFILKLIFNGVIHCTGLNIKIDTALYYFILLLLTILVAYGIGRIVDADWFDKVLEKIGIDHTVRPTIWDDAIKNYTKATIVLRSQPQFVYSGQIKLVEEDEREPIIVLCYYQIFDKNANKAITNYSTDDKKTIMLNYKDILEIEFDYQDKE